MTVVLARQYGQDIIIASDTMISDDALGKTNAIPGRLKIIALSPNVTIAYAGHADPALDIIRRISRHFISRPKEDIFELLRASTASSEHDVEFLVATHDPDADLRKIWKGILSKPLSRAAIGTKDVESKIDEVLARDRSQENARQFHHAFIRCITNKDTQLGSGVGGFPVVLKATCDGHKYKGHFVGETWKPIEFVPGAIVYEDAADLESGDWSYHFHIVTVPETGMPVVAAQLPQARTGYVYSPLTDDEAVRVDLASPDRPLWTDDQDAMHGRLRHAIDAKVIEVKELLNRS